MLDVEAAGRLRAALLATHDALVVGAESVARTITALEQSYQLAPSGRLGQHAGHDYRRHVDRDAPDLDTLHQRFDALQDDDDEDDDSQLTPLGALAEVMGQAVAALRVAYSPSPPAARSLLSLTTSEIKDLLRRYDSTWREPEANT